MKIDNAIKEFIEKYDSTAMESIDLLSRDLGLEHLGETMKLINIEENFNNFKRWLEQYADYKIKNKNNSEATGQELIKESANIFINRDLFTESSIKEFKYKDLPKFVASYAEGVQNIIETVENVKELMMNENVDIEAVGDVNTFTDEFTDHLNEAFHPEMNRILMASGYKNKLRFKNNTKRNKPPVFL